ncbi:hypothetical protein MXB_663 [Myxobolus squamalis]|nr:hypothetical protein MXB_663 [Myxobolus squamalis]
MNPGKCAHCVTRWYFNSKTFQCVSFKYGGCEGNGNNFQSQDDCIISCPKAIKEFVCTRPPSQGTFCGVPKTLSLKTYVNHSYTTDVQEMRITSDAQSVRNPITDIRRCNGQIPEEKCENNNLEIRWYYDKVAQKCQGYLSKSCSRTLNNFFNRDECFYSCVKKSCKVEPDPGNCGGRYVVMWHFDYFTRQCRTFLYSGCGGNSNRFYDNVECYDHCVRRSEFH